MQEGKQPIHLASAFGCDSLVTCLIEEYNIDPASTDKVRIYLNLQCTHIHECTCF